MHFHQLKVYLDKRNGANSGDLDGQWWDEIALEGGVLTHGFRIDPLERYGVSGGHMGFAEIQAFTGHSKLHRVKSQIYHMLHNGVKMSIFHLPHINKVHMVYKCHLHKVYMEESE